MTQIPDLDQIIARIRAEAARPEYQIGVTEPIAALTTSAGVLRSDSPQSVLPEPPVRNVDDLLLIVDRNRFIDVAYRTILGRTADAAGAAYYEEKLQSGYGQTFVIAALRASAEARSRGNTLPGFGLAPAAYLVWQVTRRIGLGFVGRLTNRAYHAWRHLSLAASGRLLTHVERARLESEDHMRAQLNDMSGLLQSIESLNVRLEELTNKFGARDDCLSAYDDRLSTHDACLAAFDERLSKLGVDVETTNTRLIKEVAVQRATLTALRLRLQPMRQQLTPAPTTAQSGNARAEHLDSYYLAFEEAHRGSEREIVANLEVYLPILAELPDSLLNQPVLDLGCGRGEWLALLSDRGFCPVGVDLNAAMVARCQSRGLDAHLADAVSWLESRKSDSHAAISGFHIIEHLPFAVLYRVVEQAWRVLAPGGLLIFETPNPENVLVGSHTFYHDFSHLNPVTPSAISFLLEYLGFDALRILRLHPYPASARVDERSQTAERLNGHLYGPQDFAIIARKPPALEGHEV